MQVHTTSPETGISLAQVQRGSEELLAWKTEARKKPETEVVQIQSCGPGQPPPSSRDDLAITTARNRLSVEQDKYGL